MATTNEKILNALDMYNSGLQKKLNEKFVQQVDGKGLSTNDFTDELKERVLSGGDAKITVGPDPPESGLWFDTSGH